MSSDGFIYGYSHFTQKRDTNAKRGYRQVNKATQDVAKMLMVPCTSAIPSNLDSSSIPSTIFSPGIKAGAIIPKSWDTNN